MHKQAEIKFDLVTNAQDSFDGAINLIAWKDNNCNKSSLKHALLMIAHAIELLLKERLRKSHPAFIWENVDKYPSLEAKTVSCRVALSRLKSISGLKFDDADLKNLDSLINTRNAIEHYEWNASVKETKTILGVAMSFLIDFAKNELNLDLTENHKNDDTWKCLIEDLREFADAHGKKLEKRMLDSGKQADYCEYCGQFTLDPDGVGCNLCGHWMS